MDIPSPRESAESGLGQAQSSPVKEEKCKEDNEEEQEEVENEESDEATDSSKEGTRKIDVPFAEISGIGRNTKSDKIAG